MPSEPTWKHTDIDQCHNCGDDAEVCTTAKDGCAHDGDSVRCVACGMKGTVTVDEDDSAYINWSEEDTTDAQ